MVYLVYTLYTLYFSWILLGTFIEVAFYIALSCILLQSLHLSAVTFTLFTMKHKVVRARAISVCLNTR